MLSKDDTNWLCCDAEAQCDARQHFAVRHLASPNCDDRPTAEAPDLLVIHSISLPPGQYGGTYIADLFQNRLDCNAHPYFDQLRDLRVSAHFLVERNGSITQFVGCGQRAWHAGASHFQGRDRCNDFSIGIELEGVDTACFESTQYESLCFLTKWIRVRYPIRAIAGHADIAPGRKTDPGIFFDWRHFATQCSLPPSLFPFQSHLFVSD